MRTLPLIHMSYKELMYSPLSSDDTKVNYDKIFARYQLNDEQEPILYSLYVNNGYHGYYIGSFYRNTVGHVKNVHNNVSKDLCINSVFYEIRSKKILLFYMGEFSNTKQYDIIKQKVYEQYSESHILINKDIKPIFNIDVKEHTPIKSHGIIFPNMPVIIDPQHSHIVFGYSGDRKQLLIIKPIQVFIELVNDTLIEYKRMNLPNDVYYNIQKLADNFPDIDWHYFELDCVASNVFNINIYDSTSGRLIVRLHHL